MAKRQLAILYLTLTFCVILNIALWSSSNRRHETWPNVPMPPSSTQITATFLGDTALAYRVWALVLQNFGNTGGNYQPLKNYNYEALEKWFFLLDRLDPHSDFVPALAAYYFSATQNPKEQISHVINYLELIGVRPEGEKWRWMAQAIYLARHKANDIPEARRLAKKLASVYKPGMPAWTLHTEAMLADTMGDKQAAYGMMKSILTSKTDQLDPAEVNFMLDYICNKILTKTQAIEEPLCKALPH